MFSLFDVFEKPEQYRQHFFAFLGNFTGGLGAVFGGVSMVRDPKIFLMLSNIFFTISAVIKYGVIAHRLGCMGELNENKGESTSLLSSAEASPRLFSLTAAEAVQAGVPAVVLESLQV